MSDQQNLSPEEALERLKTGNQRYVENKRAGYDYQARIKETAPEQHPFATILGCVDSRVVPEFVFDQNVGDLFTLRVAGNVISKDILASLEFACDIADTHLIVIKGHTNCGAVKGACAGEDRGHLGHLLKKITPAIEKSKQEASEDVSDAAFRDMVSRYNVQYAIQEVKERSPLLNGLISSGKVKIVGAIYDVHTGKVAFLD